MIDEEINNILFKADSNNSYSRPTKRTYTFRIEFKNLLDLSLFYRVVYRLGLSHQIMMPSGCTKEGNYDIVINNQDNKFHEPVKRLLKILYEHGINVLR